ncbi:MAG: hypothetical protein ACYC9S_09695 [Leptospirales bacterium]
MKAYRLQVPLLIMLKDRFVLFLDFLGSSEAATTWEADRLQTFLKLLSEIESSRSKYSETFLPGFIDHGGSGTLGTIQIAFERSSFSDHIVISCPIKGKFPFTIDQEKADNSIVISFPGNMESPDLGEGLRIDILLKEAIQWVGSLAFRALDLELLIRGGMTIGKLYHSKNVVFGEGMIDAHHLESRVALYPRVAVSPRVLKYISKETQDSLLCLDEDGIWHLNYFDSISKNVLKLNHEHPSDTLSKLSNEEIDRCIAPSRKWASAMAHKIDKNISSLEDRNKLNEMRKWVWFRKRILDSFKKDWQLLDLPDVGS